MNSFKKVLTGFAFSLLMLGVPGLVSAQWRDRDDNYGGNRGGIYNQGGYYGGDLKNAVKRLKDQSRSFAHRLDRELDHSRYDGRNREDRINDVAKNFKDAADRLEDKFGNGRNLNNSYDEANQVLRLGNQLERILSNSRLNYNLQNDWNAIRQNLNAIAGAYGDNNRRGNGGWNNNRRGY